MSIASIVTGTVAKAAGPWALYAAGGLLIALLGLGFLYRDALKDLGAADVKLERAAEANAGLLKAIQNIHEFQDEVRRGFEVMQVEVGKAQSVNRTYQGKVASDASSNTPLTAGERDALGVLFAPNPVRAGAAPAVRGARTP